MAHYVELSFKAGQPEFPSVDLPASAVRLRAYTTGAAYGLLLDRMLEGWKERVIDEGAALDELLDSVTGTRHSNGLIPSHIQQWAIAAAEEVLHQQQLLQVFDARPGKELTLKSASALWPKAFDPMNLKVVGQGRVLHQRFLQFGNGVVEGELMSCPCLTQFSGPDSFMGGFRELRLRGMVTVQATPEGWVASGNGISVRGSGGTVSTSEQGWLIDF
ncbi:hypothetical protein [Deinococcus sp. QL22]|uniref:hypothetical protein n=1 Tax=Deinococcus sp. QL22 TaxID=2939437 RepID=UPI002017711E|nr:hypothetical protein [Deinococcus sp. QL22]UQN06732.1 hypothetical protein M1R55_02080 [Deinococcus sp. QL22]